MVSSFCTRLNSTITFAFGPLFTTAVYDMLRTWLVVNTLWYLPSIHLQPVCDDHLAAVCLGKGHVALPRTSHLQQQNRLQFETGRRDYDNAAVH